MTHKIAIIGAGLSGLTAAETLGGVADVTVFEKARGVSGRLATRYASPYQFDHGAQYFTARSAAFKTWLKPHIETGLVKHWPDTERYVAVPKMNALCKTLASDLNVIIADRISELISSDQGWHLSAESGAFHGPFDWVICAMPAEQAQGLIPDKFADKAALDTAKMLPGFTLMIGLDAAWRQDWSFKSIKGSCIASIAVNSSKPGRQTRTSIVIQSGNDWAQSHVDEDRGALMALLLTEFETVTGIHIGDAPHKAIHRWLYANVGTPAAKLFLIDEAQRLAACGDWCIGGRVEAAFASGHELARHMRAIITKNS